MHVRSYKFSPLATRTLTDSKLEGLPLRNVPLSTIRRTRGLLRSACLVPVNLIVEIPTRCLLLPAPARAEPARETDRGISVRGRGAPACARRKPRVLH